MKKKLLAFALIFAAVLTLGMLSVNALEANRDAYNSFYVEGGNVTTMQELIDAFSDSDGIARVSKHPTKNNAIVLESNIIVKNPIIIKDGVYEIYGNGCTVFRGSPFSALIVLEGATTTSYPMLTIVGELTIDGMNDKYNSDSGLIHMFGCGMLEGENINFVNSTSTGEAGGALCIKTYQTEDDEQMPLQAYVSLKNCKFENCFSFKGGAIASYSAGTKLGGTYKLEGCTFKNNATYLDFPTGSGGAIYNTSGSIYIKSCTFSNNKSLDGGAIYAFGDFIMESSTCEYNTAYENGGAVYCYGDAKITGSIIQNNVAHENGGALYIKNQLNIKDAVLLDNEAKVSGGGVYIEGTFVFESGNIMNNISEKIGGGACVIGNDSKFEMKDGEIAGNRSKYCGGVYCDGDLILSGAIGNSRSEFPQIYVGGQLELKKTAIIKNDTAAIQVTRDEAGEKYYPFVRIASGFTASDPLKLAYVTVQTSDDGEVKFKNATVGGVCAIVADESTLESLKDIVEFESRGLLSYVLAEKGETAVRFIFLPVWVWIIIILVIIGVLGFVFRKKIQILFLKKKPVKKIKSK